MSSRSKSSAPSSPAVRSTSSPASPGLCRVLPTQPRATTRAAAASRMLFYFVDVDLSNHFTESAYTEISREINLGKQSPFAAHIEYDGGLSRTGSFQQSGLIGAAYNGHTADFSKTWSVQLMYKQYFKSYEDTHSYASAQLTGVWGLNFLNNKLRFSGFIDFWRGEKADGHGCLVVLSEPQLWYNFTEHFSVGTEWEFSNNFVYNTDPESSKTFFWNPTLAVKWNF